MALLDALYQRMRHPQAWSSASMPPVAGGFARLDGHQYCLLTTFRAGGEPVPTPVWFGLDGGLLYFRSEAGVGKIKRIGRDSRVLIAPCTVRGRPLGPPAEGRARLLTGPADCERAERALDRHYGKKRRLYERVGAALSPTETVYVEVAAA